MISPFLEIVLSGKVHPNLSGDLLKYQISSLLSSLLPLLQESRIWIKVYLCVDIIIIVIVVEVIGHM